ncbi:MAG: DUF3325 family protein [Acidobacteriota bacterium]
MNPDVIPSLCLLLAGCCAFGAAVRGHLGPLGKDPNRGRRILGIAGGLLLLAAAYGFSRRFGWEVGLAWFTLWFGLGTLLATLWISLKPRAAVWSAGALLATSIVGWIL